MQKKKKRKHKQMETWTKLRAEDFFLAGNVHIKKKKTMAPLEKMVTDEKHLPGEKNLMARSVTQLFVDKYQSESSPRVEKIARDIEWQTYWS